MGPVGQCALFTSAAEYTLEGVPRLGPSLVVLAGDSVEYILLAFRSQDK